VVVSPSLRDVLPHLGAAHGLVVLACEILRDRRLAVEAPRREEPCARVSRCGSSRVKSGVLRESTL
jgi:hypothetical protein